MRRRQEVKEEFGVEAGGPIESIDAKNTQQNVHWFMQVFIQDDDNNEKNIQQQNHTVTQ